MTSLLFRSILLGCAGFALFRLWRSSRSDHRVVNLAVAAGFLLRAFAGQILFWISYERLPIARGLQLGDGLWFFARDGLEYFPTAVGLARNGIWSILTYGSGGASVAFVKVLSATVLLFGPVTSVAVLLNLFCYLGVMAVIVSWSNREPRARTAAAFAICAISLSPAFILWSLQPLKDTFFQFAVIAFIGACAAWQRMWTASRAHIPAASLIAAAMFVTLLVIAGIRWYFAFALFIASVVFLLLIASMSHVRKGIAFTVSIVMAVLLSRAFLIGGGVYVPTPIIRVLSPLTAAHEVRQVPATIITGIDRAREGFDRVGGRTSIQLGDSMSKLDHAVHGKPAPAEARHTVSEAAAPPPPPPVVETPEKTDGHRTDIARGISTSKTSDGEATTTDDKAQASHADVVRADKAQASHADGVRADTAQASQADGVRADKAQASHGDGVKADKTQVSHADGVKADNAQVPHADGVRADKAQASHADGVKADKAQVSRADGVRADAAQVSRADRVRADKAELPERVGRAADKQPAPEPSIGSAEAPKLSAITHAAAPEPAANQSQPVAMPRPMGAQAQSAQGTSARPTAGPKEEQLIDHSASRAQHREQQPPPRDEPAPLPTAAASPKQTPVVAVPAQPVASQPPTPELPASTTARLLTGAASVLIPRNIGERLGLFHIGGGQGMFWFTELDTVVFDVALLWAIGVLAVRRSLSWRNPLVWLIALLTVLAGVPLVYAVTNYGTLFRLREMIYIGFVLTPLALATASRRDEDAGSAPSLASS
jgi:hypothetical protein